MSDVIVIGGGIVGASTAYTLVRAGAQVTLIDQLRPGQATAAGAGIISPGTSTKSPRAFYPLAFHAVAYYEELLSWLAEDGETDTGYETVGLLHVATSDEEAARLPLLLHLFEERKAAGVKNMGEISLLGGRQAWSLFPALGEIPGAIHTSGGARLNGRLMRNALRGAAQLRGARLVAIEGEATLTRENSRILSVEADGQTFSADTIIIAAGAWSGQFAETLGVNLPVYPQRGQILHLQGPEEAGQWPILMGFHSHYILTFPGGRVVAGATREHAAGFDVRQTAAGVAEVLNEALRVAPGLASTTLQEIRVGLRPATPDGLPILGQVPEIENVLLATGHGASGLQLGPYSGKLIADLALGKESELDLTPFSITRFQEQREAEEE
ncbi:MAG TPA: FAD-binding oxidoreductase [Ktedonobacteraceae bacterium]|nr:FAD-binding oxidoreductase [Ktedonobacteraceae bacterium]